jgi:hypothetical protein
MGIVRRATARPRLFPDAVRSTTAVGVGFGPRARLLVRSRPRFPKHYRVDLDMSAALCAFCNHANAAGSKFCSECGAALRLTLCPECEAVNDRTGTECYKCGANLYASAVFAEAATVPAQAVTGTETLSEHPTTSPSEPVEATSQASAELSGSPLFGPTDAASELPAEEPRRKSPAAVPRTESPIEGERWTPTTRAEPQSEIAPSGFPWTPSQPSRDLHVTHPRLTVPESAARALAARTAGVTPRVREAAAAPSPVPEAVTSPPPVREVISLPPRRTSTAFAIMGLLVIAAAAYYGYRNNSFAPAIAWLESTPAYQALEQWAAGWEAGNRDAEPAQDRETTAAAPDTAGSPPNPSVNDSRTTQDQPAPAAAATSADSPASPNESATPSSASMPSAQPSTEPTAPAAAARPKSVPVRKAAPGTSGDRPRERVVNRSAAVATTPPPTAQPSPAPDNAASAKAPARCSDAAAAMGLCNQDKSREGK